jgi:LCP family protein required for cell wall assembly
VLKWVAIAAFAWVAFSYAVFLVSAQLTEGVSDEAEEALSSGGSLATGSTILVLGSDERPEGSLEPGAGGPGRADSILLLRVSLGQVRRLSILRDSLAEIPGHQPQKINAAYAIGGAPLMIETVEAFLGNGLEVNHVVEISFEDFPDMINALGGIDVTIDRCIRSQPFGDRVFRLRRGTHRLTGRQALAFARVRRNFCSPNEDDRARARRQQQVLEAIRSRFLSPSTFLRLPLVSWQAPRAIRSDLKGPGLTGLFSDLLIGGTGKTRVLEPSGAGPGGSLIVSEQEKAEAVDRLVD